MYLYIITRRICSTTNPWLHLCDHKRRGSRIY